MFNPRKKNTRKGDEQTQPRKGKASMYAQRRSVFSPKRALQDDVLKPWAAVGTWFLGPKAENADVFKDLMIDAIDSHLNFRQR